MNYYNEIDNKTAAWLRALVQSGQIGDGIIDERSIADISGDDIRSCERVHLFAGIGGWDYALQLAGWEGPVWTGSCPCQPFSNAGRRKGHEDERHLWPEMSRLISECRPPTIFGEQVASKLGREWLSGVRADLEALGYVVGAADLCAASKGAPHIRQRLFWVADNSGERLEEWPEQPVRNKCESTERGCDVSWLADLPGERCESRWRAGKESGNEIEPGRLCTVGRVADCNGGEPRDGELQPGWEHGFEQKDGRPLPWSRYSIVHCTDGKARRFEPGSFPLAHGVPARVAKLRGLGNAIVPQVAAVFVRSFMEAKSCTNSLSV